MDSSYSHTFACGSYLCVTVHKVASLDFGLACTVLFQEGVHSFLRLVSALGLNGLYCVVIEGYAR